jgi:hypothetical protein
LPALTASAASDFNDSGSRVAIFLGRTWQRDSFVYGLEGDFGKALCRLQFNLPLATQRRSAADMMVV